MKLSCFLPYYLIVALQVLLAKLQRERVKCSNTRPPRPVPAFYHVQEGSSHPVLDLPISSILQTMPPFPRVKTPDPVGRDHSLPLDLPAQYANNRPTPTMKRRIRFTSRIVSFLDHDALAEESEPALNLCFL